MSEEIKKGKIIPIFSFIKRTWVDVLILIGVFLSVYFVPDIIIPEMAKMGLVSIFFSKMIFVSAGIVHAHISRKLIFPYIDFAKENSWSNNLLIIVWYAIIISSWARGG